MKNFVWQVIAFVLMAANAQAQAPESQEVRDPFAPAVGAGQLAPGDPTAGDMPPLLQLPAQDYKLMGILTSRNRGIAIVQAPSGARYYLRNGDALGAEGYIVDDMKQLSLYLKTKHGQALMLTAVSAGGSD